MAEKIDEEIARLLKTVVDVFDKEDRFTRERQVRHWRRLKLYWNNFSQIYWSETAHDYKIFSHETNSNSLDQDYYDKPINVFRAFLETIIAALSVQVPAVSCIPDDADNPLDLTTSKAGDKIGQQIYKHNNVLFLWIRALYVYCTEGLIACYTYPDYDKKYGTYSEPQYKDEEVESYVCPHCGARVPDEVISDKILDEFMPDADALPAINEIDSEGPICTECAALLDPELQKTKLIIPRLVGEVHKPKARICLEVYGGLYVKVANYAKQQKDTPYLIFAYETHYVNALEKYPKLRERFPHGGWSNKGSDDQYEAQGRTNPQYRGEEPEDNVTVRNCWLRPAAFNTLAEDDYKKLKKKFPEGVKVVVVNDIVADYQSEALDDYWTLTHNPMSDYLNHDPLGELLTNIQDVINDLISLTLQTVEHGISQTWADPAVVNFEAQRQIEAAPGTLTPTKTVAGSKNISEAFFSSKVAALSPEVIQLFRILQELGQFVSGALPSLFGGQATKGGSKTASEYSMSRSMALQRLQTPWKMLTIWWKDIFGKAIPMYMKNLKEDEKFVEKSERGNFENVFIRRAEIEGKIGDIELESSEQMPVTDEQIKDTVIQLMQMNNQELMMALMSPENLPMIRKVVKIPDFKLPGENDRQKQYEEINQLINSQPIEIPPTPQEQQMMAESGQQLAPNMQSSVEVDQLVDNHQIEADTCRSWLVSDAGRLTKIENSQGYQNVLLHMKQHMDILQQQAAAQAAQAMAQQQQQQPQKSQGQSSQSSNNANPATPVNGESNVRTPVGS